MNKKIYLINLKSIKIDSFLQYEVKYSVYEIDSVKEILRNGKAGSYLAACTVKKRDCRVDWTLFQLGVSESDSHVFSIEGKA